MSSLSVFHSESNRKVKINFAGGDLSSDSTLLPINKFAHKLGFHKFIKKLFKTNELVFKNILKNSVLASPPTLSRFFYPMNVDTFNPFHEITKELRKLVYGIKKTEIVPFRYGFNLA